MSDELALIVYTPENRRFGGGNFLTPVMKVGSRWRADPHVQAGLHMVVQHCKHWYWSKTGSENGTIFFDTFCTFVASKSHFFERRTSSHVGWIVIVRRRLRALACRYCLVNTHALDSIPKEYIFLTMISVVEKWGIVDVS